MVLQASSRVYIQTIVRVEKNYVEEGSFLAVDGEWVESPALEYEGEYKAIVDLYLNFRGFG